VRIVVDDERCQGHTQCSFTAPQLFALRDEDGHSTALVDVVPPELEQLARLACDSCPERAIVITE
jgi:ferredoxin